MKSICYAAAAAFAALALEGGSNAAPATVDGDPVLYWNEVLITGLAGSPTVTSRGFAMVDVALHDAVNATLGNPNHSYLSGVATFGGDTRAAASVAARDVLVHLNPAKTADFDAALAASLALIPDGAAKTNGIATGAAVAAATIAHRANDGSNVSVLYTPTGLPGDWAPTPPGNAPAAVPQWATSDPWLMNSVSQFRVTPPPALDSAEYTAAFEEVKAIGSSMSASRTADQSASALFWVSASGTGPWIRAGIDAAQAQGMSTLEAARLFAMLSVSVADAVIAVWDAKFTYDFWRPVTAIRGADLDGNGATMAQLDWTPFVVTPPHPSYISGHSGVAAAATTILTDAFGGGYAFCLSSGGMDRCWNSFDEAALDAANSRLWGGIHWGFDNQAGLATGFNVAQFAIRRNSFDAIPEPATWAMMIAGFGLVGGAIRRRARSVRYAFA